MRARLIVTTIVVGGFALALGAIALAGKPTRAGHVEVPRPPDRRPGSPEPRQPAAERVPPLLERHRQHGSRAVGDAASDRSGRRRRPRPSRRSARTLAVPLRDAAEAERPVLHGPLRAGRLEFEYHPTHNHWHTADVARFEVRKGSPTGTVVGGNSIKVGFCLLDLYNLTATHPRAEGRSGTATRATRESRSAGSTSTTRRRTANRSTSPASRTRPTTTSSRRRTRRARSSSRTRRTTPPG